MMKPLSLAIYFVVNVRLCIQRVTVPYNKLSLSVTRKDCICVLCEGKKPVPLAYMKTTYEGIAKNGVG